MQRHNSESTDHTTEVRHPKKFRTDQNSTGMSKVPKKDEVLKIQRS